MRARQKDFERIGKDGCYFLSVVQAGERLTGKYIDAYDVYVRSLAARYLDEECYLIYPDRILGMVTGRAYSVRKEARNYVAKEGEIVILRFERVVGRTTIGHFVLAGEDGTVEYDPYGASETVHSGSLISKRVFAPL